MSVGREQAERTRAARKDPGKRTHMRSPVKRSYGEEEIERGLVAVALASGNTRSASEALATQGVEIPRETLRNWVTRTKADRYAEVRRRELPRLREYLAEKHLDLANYQMDLSRRMADRLAATMDEIPARDLPGGIRNLDVGAAVHTDKAQLLRSEPTQIVQTKSFDELLRELKAKGISIEVVDGEAEEVEPPRLPPPI